MVGLPGLVLLPVQKADEGVILRYRLLTIMLPRLQAFAGVCPNPNQLIQRY